MTRPDPADPFGFDTPLDRSGLWTLKWEKEIELSGRADLLSFGTADMDFKSPPAVVEAITRAAQAGHFGYTYKPDSYYAAITGYLERHFGWKVAPAALESHAGIYPSMQPLINELTEPGDEILYQPPVHSIFEEIIRVNHRTAVANPLILQGGRYVMDFDGLRRLIGPRTRMLLLCSPHNPVGRVWTRAELSELAAICQHHGIIVVTDEVYGGLLYPGAQFTPYAALSEAAAMGSVTLLSGSKPFNLTGLKHSIVIAENPDLMRAYRDGVRRSNMHYGVSLFGRVGAEAGFAAADDWTTALMQYVAGNFEHLAARLAARLPQIRVTRPEATYFAWLDLGDLGLDDDAILAAMERAGLVVTYGRHLGAGGTGHIRLNLATSRVTLEQGIDRLEQVLAR